MENRFNYLLITFVLLLLFEPILHAFNITFPVGAFVFLAAIILTLRTILTSKRIFYAKTVLAFFAFLTTIMVQGNMLDKRYALVGSLIYIIFISSAIQVLFKRLVFEKKIQADTIKGGVCVYFLIGLLWSVFYTVVYIWDPAAFSYNGIADFDHQFFQYYSFTVLTTLGFGDIVPVNRLAMNLTTLEVLTGQMFLTIFVARLVGVHVSQKDTNG